MRICGTDMNITNDLVTEYLNRFYSPLSEELGALRAMGEADRVPIILKETEQCLSFLLALKQPRKILEIGTAIGYSSIFFAHRCPEAEIYTVEKDEAAYQAAKHNVAAFRLTDRIHCFLGDGQEQVEKLRDRGADGFDFVFIDAAKSHYKRFLETALSVCARDALIVSDNILQKAMTVSDQYDPQKKHKTNVKKMREYVDYICRSRELETSLLSTGDGLAVSIFRGEHG